MVVDGSACDGWSPVEKNWAAAQAPTPTTASAPTPPPISSPPLRPRRLGGAGGSGGRGEPPPASRYSGAPDAGYGCSRPGRDAGSGGYGPGAVVSDTSSPDGVR